MGKKNVALILGIASVMILTSCGGGSEPSKSSSSISTETTSETSTSSSEVSSERSEEPGSTESEDKSSESPVVSSEEEKESSESPIASSEGSSESPIASSEESSESPIASSEESPEYGTFTGVKDYTGADHQTRTEILATLESYAMKHHMTGIPLYDDASYQQFSKRIKLKSETYIPNYGFGVGESELDATKDMYNGPISEARADWRTYFHDYTTTDSGTFNYWNNTGSDVSSRNGMITSGYFEVEMTPDKRDYQWVAGLSKTDVPIQLDENGNEVEYVPGNTSKFWRVKLKTGEDGIYYSVPETSKYFGTYDGVGVELEDYITPYKALLDNRLARWSELATDSSGFAGVSAYVYGGKKDDEAWAKVGITLNKEEGAIDFEFITPKTQSYAMINLSAGLYSPLPQSFIDSIGGATRFGVRGTGSDYEKVFDNIISVGPYVPVYWQEKTQLTYKKNERYYRADEIHFDGVVEDFYADEKTAYEAFLANKLDEVTIPAAELAAHKDEPTVRRTLGSSIIKMNVNSCTEDQWEYFFGENGAVTEHRHSRDDYWDVKPIMSNDDFLDGFFFAIDRKTLAENAGRNPAIGYLGNAYMMDPDGRTPYRETDEGRSVIAPYVDVAGNEECYNLEIAQEYFNMAITSLLADDYISDDFDIELRCWYRYQETIDNIGNILKNSVEYAFNNCEEAKKHNIRLSLDLKVAGTLYTDCYNKMDAGDYDFAEGSVIGNSLNPLEFMNTVCTNSKSQGFCLNWGERTDLVSDDPLIWEDEAWSYDALWSAANSFSIIEDGVLKEISSNPRYEWEEDTNSFVLVSDYAEMFDDEGEPLFSFDIVKTGSARPGLLYSESSSIDSGIYLDGAAYNFSAENGQLRFAVKYANVRNNLLGKQYLAVQYTLVFSYFTTSSDGEMVLKTEYKDIWLIGKISNIIPN